MRPPTPEARVEFRQALTSEPLSVDKTIFGAAFIQATRSPSAAVQEAAGPPNDLRPKMMARATDVGLPARASSS